MSLYGKTLTAFAPTGVNGTTTIFCSHTSAKARFSFLFAAGAAEGTLSHNGSPWRCYKKSTVFYYIAIFTINNENLIINSKLEALGNGQWAVGM
jgi:hypothetical protein